MELPDIPFEPKSIFVAPLNWGLGHASRSADVILRLQKKYPDAQIILGSDGMAASWLRERFPELKCLQLPAYNIKYPRGSDLVAKLALRLPAMALSVIREYKAVQRIASDNAVDLMISDNRYGVFSCKCYSVFITHQLCIKSSGKFLLPVFRVLNRLIRYWTGKFDKCWIPDFAEPPGLAGELSHPVKLPGNAEYIGPLSRFRWANPLKIPEKSPQVFCIISGPEPQRKIFLDILIRKLIRTDIQTVIVAGTPGKESDAVTPSHIQVFPDLPDEEIFCMMKSCRLFVSRSGYSTIMDMYFTGRNAIFVPTPGQTEQEYLAELHSLKGNIRCISQKELENTPLFDELES